MTHQLAVMIRSVLAADDGYIHDPMAEVFAKALGVVLDECDRIEGERDRRAKTIAHTLRRASTMRSRIGKMPRLRPALGMS